MNEKIDIDIVEIDVHHPLYNEECQLRFDLVRLPLGITHKDAEKFGFEKNSLHWVALSQNKVVGCVLLYPCEPTSGKLFQLAVTGRVQSFGVGRALVRHLEERATVLGIQTIKMHARLAVIDFYRKLQYEAYGPIFAEVGIPHRRMMKELTHD